MTRSPLFEHFHPQQIVCISLDNPQIHHNVFEVAFGCFPFQFEKFSKDNEEKYCCGAT